MKQNIVVLFGGVSCEHDISIITAYQACVNIDTEKYNLYPVYICKNRVWKYIDNFDNINNVYDIAKKSKEVVVLPSSNKLYLKKKKGLVELCEVDCVVNSMHGINGEDGSVAGLLQLSGIPYTSSGILGSVVGIDKCAFKTFLMGLGVSCASAMEVKGEDYFKDVKKCLSLVETKLGYPVIIKPASLGSSIGIKVCKKSHDLANFIENALKFDKKVLIEKYFDNIIEYNIALYKSLDGLRISSIESPISSDEILSFNNKYLSSSAGGEYINKRRKKVKIDKSIKKKIEDISTEVYMALDCAGVVRFDYILTNDDDLYLNEINTIPGSLANYLFSNINLDFSDQLNEQIFYAIHDKLSKDTLIQSFESGVLQNIDFSNMNKYK